MYVDKATLIAGSLVIGVFVAILVVAFVAAEIEAGRQRARAESATRRLARMATVDVREEAEREGRARARATAMARADMQWRKLGGPVGLVMPPHGGALDDTVVMQHVPRKGRA